MNKEEEGLRICKNKVIKSIESIIEILIIKMKEKKSKFGRVNSSLIEMVGENIEKKIEK